MLCCIIIDMLVCCYVCCINAAMQARKRPRDEFDAFDSGESVLNLRRYLVILVGLLSSVAAACLCILIMEQDAANVLAEDAAKRSEGELLAIVCLAKLLYRRHFGEKKARGGNKNYDLVCRKMEKKPKQFHSNFRMDSTTFNLLFDRLWRDHMEKFKAACDSRCVGPCPESVCQSLTPLF